jgi:hypothetical protein
MARRPKDPNQPAVSKPVMIFGAVALGAAVLFFVVTTFLGGGGGEEEIPGPTPGVATSPATGAQPGGGQPAPGGQDPGDDPTPSPTIPGLTEGGRDPFDEPGGAVDPGADPQ